MPPCVTARVPLLMMSSLLLAAHAENLDSLAYRAVYDEIRALGTYPAHYEAYMEAAEGLAAEGLYDDAQELLLELFAGLLETGDADSSGEAEAGGGGEDTGEGGTARAPWFAGETSTGVDSGPREATLTWRLSMTASYDHFDDVYLTGADEDSLERLLDSLDELDQQPFNGHTRASLTWEPSVGPFERIVPALYISNSRLRGGVDIEGSMAKGGISFGAGASAHKRLFESYGDSSDALTADARVRFSTRPLTGLLYGYLPVEWEAQEYRRQRAHYLSYWELAIGPAAVFESADFSRRLEMSWRHLYRRHRKPVAEDDEICYGPHLVAELAGPVLSTALEGALRWERFPNRLDPAHRKERELLFRATARPLDWFDIALEASGLWRNERYDRQTLLIVVDTSFVFAYEPSTPDTQHYRSFRDIVASYALGGRLIDARLSVGLHLPLGLRLRPACSCERGIYGEKTAHDSQPLYDTLYISESYIAYEPGLSLQADRESWYASVGLSYRREDIVNEHHMVDYEAWRPVVESTWRIRPWMTLDLYASYDRRAYATGEIEENLSASLSAGLRF